MDLKSKLEIKYDHELSIGPGQMDITVVIGAFWRNEHIIGHTLVTSFNRAVTQPEIETAIQAGQEDLKEWFDNFVVNYDDLTPTQKKRADKVPNSEFMDEKIAIVKSIRLRHAIKEDHATKEYGVFEKIVICELKE